MILSLSFQCNLQELSVNLNSLNCVSTKIKLIKNKNYNALCEDCEFNPELDYVSWLVELAGIKIVTPVSIIQRFIVQIN